MQRSLVEPAEVSGAPLSELKAWLSITRPNEDELLKALLLTSLEACEAFTGRAPLSQVVEERLPSREGRFCLNSRPVITFEEVTTEAANGDRYQLEETDYTFERSADLTSSIQIKSVPYSEAIVIKLRVGLGQEWSGVPSSLRQGIIRLAAHGYRERDTSGGANKAAALPAGVLAHWHPWREVTLQ